MGHPFCTPCTLAETITVYGNLIRLKPETTKFEAEKEKKQGCPK